MLFVINVLLTLGVGCKGAVAPASAEPSKKTGLSGLKGPAKKTGLSGLKGPAKKTGLSGLKGPAKKTGLEGLRGPDPVKHGEAPPCRKPGKEDLDNKKENLKKLQHVSGKVRGRALDSLRFLLGQDAEVRNAFIRILQSDPAWYMRELAIEELVCLIEREEVSRAFARALKEEKDCHIRGYIPKVFMRLSNEELVSKIAIAPMLAALENDTCAEIRAKVIVALGEIWARWNTSRSEKILRPLIKALNDSHVGVRCEAAEALNRMRNAGKTLPLLSKVKNIKKVELESCSEVRKWVLKSWLYRRAVNDEDVRKVIEDHKQEIKWCYEEHKDSGGKKRGEVRVRIYFDASGQVARTKLISSSMDNHETATCIVQAARRWVFPKHKDTAEGLKYIIFDYPFNVGENK